MLLSWLDPWVLFSYTYRDRNPCFKCTGRLAANVAGAPFRGFCERVGERAKQQPHLSNQSLSRTPGIWRPSVWRRLMLLNHGRLRNNRLSGRRFDICGCVTGLPGAAAGAVPLVLTIIVLR